MVEKALLEETLQAQEYFHALINGHSDFDKVAVAFISLVGLVASRPIDSVEAGNMLLFLLQKSAMQVVEKFPSVEETIN